MDYIKAIMPVLHMINAISVLFFVYRSICLEKDKTELERELKRVNKQCEEKKAIIKHYKEQTNLKPVKIKTEGIPNLYFREFYKPKYYYDFELVESKNG